MDKNNSSDNTDPWGPWHGGSYLPETLSDMEERENRFKLLQKTIPWLNGDVDVKLDNPIK